MTIRNVTARSINYDYLTKEAFEVTATITLVGEGLTDGQKWKHDAGHVRLTLRPNYGQEMALPYRTGLGHRKGDRPSAPDIAGILYSIGSDYQVARNLPGDEPAALDELAAEFGYDKPGEALRVLRAVQSQAADLRRFLKGTGIDADHFADWCIGLEA